VFATGAIGERASFVSEAAPSVLLGVAGGIAAYKSAALTSLMRDRGWQVTVAMTPSSQKFVTPETFAAASGQPVLCESFPDDPADLEATYPHLYPATKVDACVLAPATANLIAKAAHGIGDEVVSTALLSLPRTAHRVFCPAMNVEMWDQEVVQRNVATLGALGWRQVGPDSGHLACGVTGAGRMSEPEAIVDVVAGLLAADGRLAGKRVLMTSGPTVEHIDPVRFLSNHSSGRMGKVIAEAAAAAGATVDFVTGPVHASCLPRHPGIRLHNVVSAHDMLEASRAFFPEADAAIFVAAVADYMPAAPMPHKAPKKLTGLSIPLVPNHDIAKELCTHKRPEQHCIGFALETQNGVDNAKGKISRKKFDAIVLNGVSSFGGDAGHFTWIEADGEPEVWGDLQKVDCAGKIVSHLVEMLGE
jgi:phosphopantothenoylcysteine decarboxylase/phosphopantothenate--cysteine ligase